MREADYELVLDVMHKHREEGVSLMALARETRQRLPDLQISCEPIANVLSWLMRPNSS